MKNALGCLLLVVVSVVAKSELPTSMSSPIQQFWTPSSRSHPPPPLQSPASTGISRAGFFGITANQQPTATVAPQTQNTLPANNPVDMYLKHRQVGYRNTGFLTGTGKHVPTPTFNRLPTPTNSVKDPFHGRYGGFNLPANPAPILGPLAAQGNLGPVRPGGHHGLKSAPGFFQNPQVVRDGRIYENYKPRDPLKKTGVYVIPTPSTLYYDGVKSQ